MNSSYLRQHLDGFRTVYITQALLNGCFYGMRAIFVLYAIKQFSLDEAQAIHLFATFMILCYGTSLVGGYIADNGLGVKNALMMGCLFSALGLLGILSPWQDICLLGLALFSLGSGFIKPNISAAVGLLFENPQDPRKDQAYSFLYVAMNLGSFTAPIICSYIGHLYGWYYGILLISAGFLGTLYFINKKMQFHPIHKEERTLSCSYLFGISLIFITLLYLIFKFQDHFHSLMGLITIGSLTWLGKVYYQCNLQERKNIAKIIGYIFLFAISCALSEQAATSLMLFYDKAVNRQLMDMVIPASAFLSLNPLIVLICGPILLALSYKYLEKTKPIKGFVKVGCSFLCIVLSFGVLALSISYSNGLISPLWVLAAVLIQTLGELWIAPISFAKISHYAPEHFKSFLMSFWSMAIAYGHYLAGFMAQFSVQNTTLTLKNSLEQYQSFFIYLSLLPLFIGLVLLLCQGYQVVRDCINIKKRASLHRPNSPVRR